MLITSAEHEALASELVQLRQQSREEIARRLREARSFGDDSNNDEYHAVLEEQMVLEARIASLEEELVRATVIDPADAAEGVAVIGSTVVIEDLEDRRESRHRLVGAHTGARDTISAASPMGDALLGARAGDVVRVELPNGRSRSVRLLAVERPAAAG